MRVAQIGPYPLSRDCIFGGVEASVFGLAQQQSQTIEVHVFDIPRQEGRVAVEKDGEVIVHRFRNEGKRQVSISRQVKSIALEIRAANPDVCHLHSTSLFSLLMYRKLTRMGLKTIVTVHGLARVEKRNMLRKGFTAKRLFQFLYQGRAEKRLLSQIPVAIVDTEYVRDMLDCYPIRKKPKIFVVPQGINEDYYSLNCSEISHVFLSVGAIGVRKGHLLTLKAFKQLRQNGVVARLVIVGTIADSSYYDDLKISIENSDYQKDISLFVDLSGKELRQQYGDAHVFVLHSEEESQGIVFAEAMATGMPVVSTNVGGIPYVVKNGITGLLSDYGDVSAFAKQMEKLMSDTSLWQFMSRQSKQEAEDYHWSKVADKVLELYQTFIQ